jgi:hypothetical protein
MRLDTANVKSRFVGRSAVTAWRGPKGLYVLVPDHEALANLVANALAPPPAQSAESAWRVEVVNGTLHSDWGHVAAERLRWEGFHVTQVGQAGEPQPRTQMTDFTVSGEPGSATALYQLMSLYRRGSGDLVPRPTEDRGVDFSVVLGVDYDPCTSARSR